MDLTGLDQKKKKDKKHELPLFYTTYNILN